MACTSITSPCFIRRQGAARTCSSSSSRYIWEQDQASSVYNTSWSCHALN
jgi:hypothetical protein